jgi:UDP-glucose 4-epimerase
LKSVVTGGLGFVGSHLVDRLVGMGHEVVVIDDLSTGRTANKNPRARYHRADVIDSEEAWYAGAQWIFHMAALPRVLPSLEDPLGHERANVVATIALLQKLGRVEGRKRLVFASSATVYGDAAILPTPETVVPAPQSPYGIQKLAGEHYCFVLGKYLGIEAIALRYFNIYGTRSYNPENPGSAYSSVLGIFAYQKGLGRPLTVTGTGEQSRDFIHVSDVVGANLAAAEAPEAALGRVYNVGSGTRASVIDIARLFDHPIEFLPARAGEVRTNWADIALIEAALGWKPRISLAEGIGLL